MSLRKIQSLDFLHIPKRIMFILIQFVTNSPKTMSTKFIGIMHSDFDNVFVVI